MASAVGFAQLELDMELSPKKRWRRGEHDNMNFIASRDSYHFPMSFLPRVLFQNFANIESNMMVLVVQPHLSLPESDHLFPRISKVSGCFRLLGSALH